MHNNKNFALLLCLIFALGATLGHAQEPQTPEIEKIIRKIALKKATPQDWYDLGEQYYEAGYYENAEQQFRKTLEQDPNHLNARFKLGNLYFYSGRLDDAQATYEAIIEQFGDQYAGVFINLATVYEAREAFDRAAELYRKAVSLIPNSPEPYYGMGDVLFKMEQWDEAARFYEMALELMSERPANEHERKNRQVTLERLEEAQKGGILSAETLEATLAQKPATRGLVLPLPGRQSRSVALRNILFDSNATDLDKMDENTAAQLRELAKAMKRLTRTTRDTFIIEGHTDKRGPAAYNKDLSLKRAVTVRDFLVTNGAVAERLEVVGRGEEDLVSDGDTLEDHRKNRRVVIRREFASPLAGGLARRDYEAPPESLTIAVICQFPDGLIKVLREGERLPRQARYRLECVPQKNMHLYVLRRRNGANTECLFPRSFSSDVVDRSGKNPSEAFSVYYMPSATEFYEAPDQGDSLSIQFYAATEPIAQLEELAYKADVIATVQTRGILPMGVADTMLSPPDTVEPYVAPAVLFDLPEPVSSLEIPIASEGE